MGLRPGLLMMKFAAGIKCPNPACSGLTYDALVESGYHAECPNCHQLNRVAGVAMSNEIDGNCRACSNPLDHHIFGRRGYACPPRKDYAR